MLKKLKFYFIGFIPGLLVVLFILNKKGTSCSYFPNDRVIAESMTKPVSLPKNIETELTNLQIDKAFLKDSIIGKGKIDFDKSQAQKQPFPEYYLTSPEKNPKYEITYEKGKDSLNIKTFKKIR
ncbi:hypothetical protein G6R40_00640 [Chryseobacterium sp. POL2]|uniref:hypothetical protein n=1 Tax=Chryseobacterium sp. POL2 TaxID=2713414 RepID=UPI0013E1E752|nr:hypothetical protein [Chryseobacterium sp. POL2]QIG88249.1 hypothetical protein G6R40_00640 [Chryseobacterium sp. POL2]